MHSPKKMTNKRVRITSTILPMLLTTAAALSSFHGSRIILPMTTGSQSLTSGASSLVMRKQKASDKRTARLQRGQIDSDSFTPSPLSTSSSTTQILSSTPMSKTQWKHKKVELRSRGEKVDNHNMSGGRGRARKRLKLYNSLASYHSTFSNLISAEYQVEEAEVIQRLEASIGDPFSLEEAGHAIFDVHPQRRGNLFNDEVYRLEKSLDATTTYFQSNDNAVDMRGRPSPLPANHKFSANDVIVITLQPRGTGDFLGVSSLPTNKDAVLVEARVLNVGPSYVDVAIPAGKFSTAFGPASNNVGDEGKGDPNLRVRVDRFFSDVPFKRMAAALGQLTSVPQQNGEVPVSNPKFDKRVGGFQMDNLLKEAILSTFAIKDDTNLDGIENPSLGDLPKKLAKPPLPASIQWADQVMAYIKANPSQLFPVYNEPQLTAIRSALTRRLTLIQGPPGTGKTTVAGSVAFGFVHQCRKISPHCKVLATAFSNVGADNMAEKFLSLGLKVVRVGKPSGVSESLWSYTLDAAIQRDPNAQNAINAAAEISAKVKKQSTDRKSRRNSKQSPSAERAKRDAVTQAVKDSIQACNIAATRALREADVIVSTSVGAADAQLLAACGIYPEEDEQDSKNKNSNMQDSTTLFGTIREFAPDNLPPLSLPFVIIDEACQSVEPASLIPIVSTNSCRSLVMLGDPCQLPPTVRSDTTSTGESPLSISLMSRLASIMPQPVTVTAQKDNTPLETKFIQCKPTRQALSRVKVSTENISYRKQFSGSLLLSVQYRMHPSIAAFSSAIFYNELLTSPSTLTKVRQFPSQLNSSYPAAETSASVRFVRVGGRDNEAKGEISESGSGLVGSSSYRNHAEAEAVVELLRSLLAKNSGFDGSIGIVTPYSAQVALIKSLMARDDEFRSLAQSFPHEIEVKSVDAYQGRERDLIIFSAVRSNRHGRVGFLADWRRMNVALTRAKNGLVVVGDADTLKEGDKHWDAFVLWCENMGCLVDKTKAGLGLQ